MDKREIVSSTVWLCIVAIVAISSLRLGIGEFHNPGPGFFPFWSSVGIALLTIMMFGINLFKKTDSFQLADLWRDLHWDKNVKVVAALFAYCLVLTKLGYIFATLLLMLILFYIGRMKPWAVIIASVLAVALSYSLFHYGLKTPLPKGIWAF